MAEIGFHSMEHPMTNMFSLTRAFLVAFVAVVSLTGSGLAAAAEEPLLEQDSKDALKSLYAGSPVAKDINTLTAKSDVYAMIFDQKGLMAGVGLQGSKITKINR